MNRIVYDSHIHTPLCNHAVGSIDEYASTAERRDLKGIIITCHNPIPTGWSPSTRMKMDQFGAYLSLVQDARDRWAGRLDILLGLESDYLPEMEGWLTELHTKAPFHYILGSVHAHIPDYIDRFYQGDVREFERIYFDHLASAAESGLFHALAHPDVVKLAIPESWDIQKSMDSIKRSLDRIAKTGAALELNTSGLNKIIPEMNPGIEFLNEMKIRGIPVVVGSDAHDPSRAGADFQEAFQLLLDVGYTTIHHFINGKKCGVSIQEAIQSLRQD